MPLSRFTRSRFVTPKFARQLFSPPPAAGAASLTTISFIASATSNAASVTAPATIDAGDLLVLMDAAKSLIGIPTTVVPSGFTSLVNLSGNSFGKTIWSAKIALGTEDGASITGMDGASADDKVLMQFRGNVAISAFSTAQSPVGSAGEGDPGGVTITASGGVVPLIAFAGYSSLAAISPRTFSPAADAEISSGTGGYAKYKIYNSSPANISIDMDDEDDFNALNGFYINLS